MRVVTLPLSAIHPNPEQHRQYFDPAEIANLAKSIVAIGLQEPITVQRTGEGFRLISGERRYRAHKLAGLSNIEAIVIDVGAVQAKIREISTNLHGVKPNAIEEGRGFRDLAVLARSANAEVHLEGMAAAEVVAAQVHKAASYVFGRIRLASLPVTVTEFAQVGALGVTELDLLASLLFKQTACVTPEVNEERRQLCCYLAAQRVKGKLTPEGLKARITAELNGKAGNGELFDSAAFRDEFSTPAARIWRKFVEELKEAYSKAYDAENRPKYLDMLSQAPLEDLQAQLELVGRQHRELLKAVRAQLGQTEAELEVMAA